MTRTLAALAVLAAAAPAPAQPTSGVAADGTEIFRAMLHVNGIRPVTAAQLNMMPAEERRNAIVIVRSVDTGPFGSGEIGDRLQPFESAYLGGAAVLVLASRPGSFKVLGAPDVQIARNVEPDPDPPGDFYPGPPALAQPLVRLDVEWDRMRRRPTDLVWDVFRGLNRVATETRSVIRMPEPQRPFLHAVAGFRPRRSGYLAAGSGEPGPGGERFLAVADPNIFSNERLTRDGTDNWELALRVVAFLKAERRTVACFAGRDSTEPFDALFQYGRPPLPMPHIPSLMNKLAEAGNGMIDRAQQQDVLTRAVLGNTPEGQERGLANVLRGLAVAAAVWAAWFVLRRVWGARQPAAAVPPPPDPGRPPTPDPDGVFDRRQQELLRRDNLYEPVRDLVRGLMAEAGAPPAPGSWVPPVACDGDPRFARRLRQVIGELWRVGYGDPKPVGARRWRELEPKLELARRAFENGTWRFAAAGSTA